MTSVLSSTLEMTELYNQNRRLNSLSRYQTSMDRRHIGSNLNRHRNLSGPTTVTGTGSTLARTLDNRALATPPPGVPGSHSSVGKEVYSLSQNATTVLVRDNGSQLHAQGSNRECARTGSSNTGSTREHVRDHRRLDRSASDNEHDRLNGNHGSGGGRGVNSSRYKTELCRPFEESGHCKYGDKCQFAHGAHELRNLARHPKYKTERCRTFHTIGFCPYGPRCHFIHNEDERINKNYTNQQQQQRMLTAAAAASSSPSLVAQRPTNLHGLAALGCSFDSSTTSSSSSSPGHLSPVFTADDVLPSSSSSLSPASSSSDSGSPRSSPVFNFPASDASGVASLLTPLNIQTQQFYNNMVDMAALQFSAMLNLKNQHGSCATSAVMNVTANFAARSIVPDSAAGAEDCWTGSDFLSDAADLAFPLPPGSPNSLSDDSMGSTGSLSSVSGSVCDTLPPVFTMYDSPLDLGKSLRLPIFNNLNSSM